MMFQAKHYMYKSGIMSMRKDDAIALASRHIPQEEVLLLSGLLDKISMSIMIKDKVYQDDIMVRLIHDCVPPENIDIDFYEFVSNTMSSVYMSLPLVRIDEIDEYVSRMLRLRSTPANAVMKLSDQNINITEKMNILGPVLKIWSMVEKISKEKHGRLSAVNLIDASILQMPLDWFMNMFCSNTLDDRLTQLLISISILKSISQEKIYDEVYKVISKVIREALVKSNGHAFIDFLNDYNPEDNTEYDEITTEDIIDTISRSNMDFMLKKITTHINTHPKIIKDKKSNIVI